MTIFDIDMLPLTNSTSLLIFGSLTVIKKPDGFKKSRDTRQKQTLVSILDVSKATLQDVGSSHSTIKISGFPQYQHLDYRKSTVYLIFI
jgi:hypothetical protein